MRLQLEGNREDCYVDEENPVTRKGCTMNLNRQPRIGDSHLAAFYLLVPMLSPNKNVQSII